MQSPAPGPSADGCNTLFVNGYHHDVRVRRAVLQAYAGVLHQAVQAHSCSPLPQRGNQHQQQDCQQAPFRKTHLMACFPAMVGKDVVLHGTGRVVPCSQSRPTGTWSAASTAVPSVAFTKLRVSTCRASENSAANPLSLMDWMRTW